MVSTPEIAGPVVVAKRKVTPTKPVAKKQPAKKPVKKPAAPKVSPEAKALALLFHDTYEKLAPKYAYETKPETRKFKPTSKNGKLMLAVAAEILAHQPKPKPPKFTTKDFEQYFYALELTDFVQYTQIWNETRLKIKVPKHNNYDQWLNYFKTLSPSVIRQLAVSGMDFMPVEGYAALSLWHDIIKSPHRIGKIYQAGLTNEPAKNHKSIIDLARNNDRMGVLCAVRDQLAEKLEKGAGARDMASLAREMGDVLDQIAELEKRAGPKKGTKVAELLGEFDVRRKRPGYDGGGARKTSFKSRVTIDDTEVKV